MLQISRAVKSLLKGKWKIIILLAIGIAALIVLGRQVVKSGNSVDCKNCNVILVTLTNLRYDHMSGNDYFRPTTPNLDELSKKSLVFENTYAHSSWTLPEGISIYSSLYPYQHGIMNRFDGSTLSKDSPTLVDELNKQGYRTAAFTGGFDYDPRFGLTNRYGEYQGCTNGDEGDGSLITTLGYGKVGCSVPKALNWIRNNSDSKFFVHIQGYDTHCPFSQNGGLMYDKDYKGSIDFSNCLWTFKKADPIVKDGKKYYPVYSSKTGVSDTILLNESDVNHLIALYDESITESDAIIGSFLDEITKMGLDGNTIIVFTSEHGDMLGKYGMFMRGGPLRGTFYDDVLKVPLIFKIPGLSPSRYEQLVEHVDIAPTVLDLLSIKQPSEFVGKSLMPVINNGINIHDFVFSGSEYNPGMENVYFNESTRIESIRSNRWKLIKETVLSEDTDGVTMELYDVINDKEELNDVSSEETGVLKDLEKRLMEWSNRYNN